MRQSACHGCGERDWVNKYSPTLEETLAGVEEGEYCGDCFELLTERKSQRDVDPTPRKSYDPGWDDAVRALEGDYPMTNNPGGLA